MFLRKILKIVILSAGIFGYGQTNAHSLPNSKAQFYINQKQVLMQFKTPVEIMELASKFKIDLSSKSSLDSIKNYFIKHLYVTDTLNSIWKVTVGEIKIQETKDSHIGNFPELTVEIFLIPSKLASLKNFKLHCDAIMHQIPNQSILCSVDQDWKNGIVDSNQKQLGVISIDFPTNTIYPLQVTSDEGSNWTGFVTMINLGIKHIKTGLDHLLFLLVLLIPAMQKIKNNNWTEIAGFKTSLIKIIKIVTCFTLGHSLTLILCAFKLINVHAQPIEVLIAISILITAINAIKPIFKGRETWVAAGFGLIHGMAFASTIQNLNLDFSQFVLSVLGFNIGIELFQLLLVILALPILYLLSRSPKVYRIFRLTGASICIILACAWALERITNSPNFITSSLEKFLN